MKIEVDVKTIEEVTKRYLQEVYENQQKAIVKFMTDRLSGSPGGKADWDDFYSNIYNTDGTETFLRAIMSKDHDETEYLDYVNSVRNKYYTQPRINKHER